MSAADAQLFNTWLERTRELQKHSYGTDPSALDGDERADYFRTMGFALIVELAELSQEIGWKTWGTDRSIDHEHYVKELVDVLHFAGNLAVLAGITDEELSAAYLKKMLVNEERMLRSEYNGRTDGKCPACKRSFDDVDQADGTNICVKCLQVGLSS